MRLAVLALYLVGCNPSGHGADVLPRGKAGVPDQMLGPLVQDLIVDSEEPSLDACDGRVLQPARTVVVFHSSLCFACRDLGYLLRRVVRDTASFPPPVLIATDNQSSPVVCRYLRGERAYLPVVELGPRANWLELGDSILVVVETNRGPTRLIGRSGIELMQNIAPPPLVP